MHQHATESFVADVIPRVDFVCRGDVSINGTCTFSGIVYPCNAYFDATTLECSVSGSSVIELFKRIRPGKWSAMGWLLLIGVCCRVAVAIFYVYPVRSLLFRLRHWFTSSANVMIMSILVEMQRLRRTVETLQQVDYTSTTPLSMGNRFDDGFALRDDAQRDEADATVSLENLALNLSSHSGRSLPGSDANLIFRDVTVTLKRKKKVILEGVSGMATAGRVCALMGMYEVGRQKRL